jgi:hypothetical protein
LKPSKVKQNKILKLRIEIQAAWLTQAKNALTWDIVSDISNQSLHVNELRGLQTWIP